MKTVTVEVTEEEFALIEEAARIVELPMGDLVREAVKAVARSARARAAIRVPIRLESPEPIGFPAMRLPDDGDPPLRR